MQSRSISTQIYCQDLPPQIISSHSHDSLQAVWTVCGSFTPASEATFAVDEVGAKLAVEGGGVDERDEQGAEGWVEANAERVKWGEESEWHDRQEILRDGR